MLFRFGKVKSLSFSFWKLSEETEVHLFSSSSVSQSSVNPIISPQKAILGFIRSSRPEVFLGKGVLNICSKFTGEHPCRIAIFIAVFYLLLFTFVYFILFSVFQYYLMLSLIVEWFSLRVFTVDLFQHGNKKPQFS